MTMTMQDKSSQHRSSSRRGGKTATRRREKRRGIHVHAHLYNGSTSRLLPLLLVLLLMLLLQQPQVVHSHADHVNPELVPPHSEDAHDKGFVPGTADAQARSHAQAGKTINSPLTKRVLRLVLMPKSVDNPFFDPSGDGCRDTAALLSTQNDNIEVQCNYTGPPADADDNSGEMQAQMVRELVASGEMDALAIAVRSVEVVGPAIQEAVAANIPVVTFDSDAPDSGRLCYIGTDNYFFGTQIGKLLKQLQPNGGTFTFLYSAESLNLQQRAQGFLDEMNRDPGVWKHVATADAESNITKAMELMHSLAEQYHPTAIAPVMGMPMRSGTWKEFVNTQRASNRNITLISGDAMSNQIQFLERGYVHGLVGQLPYDFGKIAAQTLYDVLVHKRKPASDVIGTNVITLVQVPLVLPELNMDNNLIDQSHLVGFILFAIVTIMATGFAIWTYVKRDIHAVKVAQPMFLIMVAAGTLVLASALIPLSFDDEGYPDSLNESESTAICMSIPWLASSGFTITFSALFAKTWRVNKIFHNSNRSFTRVTVTMQDVIVPFFVLMSLNTLILALWTAIDPLTYQRKELEGTDGWNRPIASIGVCQSENHGIAFLIPMAIINASVLLLANWQAYQARMIQSEFSESKYIGIAMASLLQAMISGIPILFVVREQPQAYYLVLCFMIFVICAVVLLVIFVPKMVLVEKFSNESPAEQKKRIMSSIRQSRASITQGRKTNSNNNNNNSNNKGSGVSFASDISGNLHGSSRVFDTDPETAPSTPVLQKKSITSKTTVTGGSNSTTTRKDVLRSNTTNEKEKPLSIFEDFKSEIEDNKNDNYKGGDEEEKREEDDKSVETSNNCNHLNETENNGEQRQIRIAEASEVDSDDQSQVRFSRD